MNYQKKRKRQMIIIRIVAIVCAVLIWVQFLLLLTLVNEFFVKLFFKSSKNADLKGF